MRQALFVATVWLLAAFPDASIAAGSADAAYQADCAERLDQHMRVEMDLSLDQFDQNAHQG